MVGEKIRKRWGHKLNNSKKIGLKENKEYGTWFQSAWDCLNQQKPFSVEDVRSMARTSYDRIIREASLDLNLQL